MNQKSKQKRMYLVNRDFQMRYAGAAALVGVVSTVLTTSLILLPLYQFEILRIPRFLPIPVLGIMFLAGILNIALIGFMGIFLTHKIAGPMYSLVRHFRGVEESGQWHGNMRLRDGDDLRYIVRNYNAMMDSIGFRLHNDLQQLANIRQELEGFNDQAKLDKTLKVIQELEADIRSRVKPEDDNSRAS